jgi:hypothetical protein
MSRRLSIVLAALGVAFAAAPAGAAEPGGEPRTPISSAAQLFTCCTSGPLQERLFGEAAASGAEFVRVDVELHGIFDAGGTRERPNWTRLDEMTARARRHGVRLLGIIRGTPTWLSSCPERGSKATICAPRDPARWGRLAGEVAAHARGSIDHWEIVNEPDARWAFTGSAEDYARMLRASHDAIKAGAPGAQVVFGGVERPREHDWIERVLATPGADAIHAFDIAAVHLRLRLRNELDELPQWLTAWRALLARRGFHGPIWVTEHGYPADPAFQWDPAYRGADTASGDAAQAALLRDSIPLLANAGAGQVFITLRDFVFGEFLSEGIAHVDDAGPPHPSTRRSSFDAVRQLALTWNRGAYARSGGRVHDRQADELRRLAQESQAAGRPVAAALQEGAAEGHALVALELVRAAAASSR